MVRAFLLGFFRFSSLVLILLLGLISAGIWFYGARLTFEGYAPLAEENIRIAAIAGLFIFFFLVALIRVALTRRANARLINAMLVNEDLATMGVNYDTEEVEIIRERFENALRALKNRTLSGSDKKGGHFLFELPWYVLIGPSGTGKTTLLRNSGLEFPLSDQLGTDSLHGIGGTRNCDWWIAEEAVLIDTAGRYTTQDVNQRADAAAWNGFLDLLKTHRGRRPLNGVIITISIADAILVSEEERARQAELLRARLRELHRALKVRLPVYLIFAKCDLIAGFEEFFETLSEEEREQIWGMTFSPDETQVTYGSLFESRFRELADRLDLRTMERLAAERSNSRRARIYAFPQEFACLAPILRSFVSDVFRVARNEAHPMLRGVYFTSSIQEGTPFDRILTGMSRAFALAPGQQEPMTRQSKAFFIRRLMREVILVEQNLVGRNRAMERRLLLSHAMGYFLIFIFGSALSGYWLWGLEQSKLQIQAATDALAKVEKLLPPARRDLSLIAILPALDATKNLEETLALPPFLHFLAPVSIDARPKLSPLAAKAYTDALLNLLLPAALARLETQISLLNISSETSNLLLRDQLAVYLMLTTGQNFSPSDIKAAFENQAEAVLPLDPDLRAVLNDHFAALLPIIPPGGSPGNQTVTAAARARLAQLPQPDVIYRTMLTDSETRFRLAPVSLVSVVGSGALRLSSLRPEDTTRIPGFYTRDGFYNFFLPRLPEYIRGSLGRDWVLGEDPLDQAAYNKLAREVVNLYTTDYIDIWRRSLNQLTVVDMESLNRAELVLQELSGPSSSLARVLQVLRDNTELPLPSMKDENGNPITGQLGTGSPSPEGGVITAATDALQESALSAAIGDGPWPGNIITDAFRPLTSLVDPQAQGLNRLDRVLQLFGDLYGRVAGITSAPRPAAAAFDVVVQRAKNPASDSFTTLRAEAATKPDPIRSIATTISNRTWGLMMSEAYHHANDVWKEQVVPVCNQVLQDRYPFTATAVDEVSLSDFADLFKPGGIIDQYFTNILQPFVTVRGRQLSATEIQGVTLGVSEQSLEQFARAQIIRDSFFAAAGAAPEAKFTVQPDYLDPGALRSTLVIDDQEVVYRHGPIRSFDVTWPSKLDASTASFEVRSLDGKTTQIERNGTWAIFRLLSASNLTQRAGTDGFIFSVETLEGIKASYRLQASSVDNPFNLSLYTSFRCPPML